MAIQEQTHPNLYPLAGNDRRLTYSNGAVQIRVGLELAEIGIKFDDNLENPNGGLINGGLKPNFSGQIEGNPPWKIGPFRG